jgi:branched-subunit amino acid aminotransferase/4-amino-4-deoxychorismate lyase
MNWIQTEHVNCANTQGYGCYTTLRLSVGPLARALHWQRLAENAQALALYWPDNALDALESYFLGLKAKQAFESAVLRVSLMAQSAVPFAQLWQGVPSGPIASIVIPHIREVPIGGNDVHDSPTLKLITVAHTRMLPQLKHTSLVADMLQKRTALQAHQDGAQDVIWHDTQGLISEAATASVIFYENGQWLTPQAQVLPSITLAQLRQHHVIAEAPCTVERLQNSDAVILLNAARGPVPVHHINSVKLPWPNQARLQYTAFHHQWQTLQAL